MASVHKHGNRWRVKWYSDTGRQLVESFPTEADAREAARRVEAQTVLDRRPPDLIDGDTLTVARWWARWEPGRPWRASTRTVHDQHWRLYIRPVFGGVPLENISSADISRWHRRLEARGLAPGSVRAIHKTFAQALEAAVLDGLLQRNPARAAKLRRTPAHPAVALDTATLDAMLAAIAKTSPELGTFARLIAATGLRLAETAGLTWDRIDLKAGLLVVDRQIDWDSSATKWTPTKTTETRRVPLTPAVVADLEAWKESYPPVGDDLLFTQPDGRRWARSSLSKAWRDAAKTLKPPLPAGARGWHTLRHTVSTRLLEAGVPVTDAAGMLGHSPEMLLTTYAHISDQAATDARLRAALS
jgi:integrase